MYSNNGRRVLLVGTINTGMHEASFFSLLIQAYIRDREEHKYEIYPTDLNLSAIISHAYNNIQKQVYGNDKQ